MEMQTFRFDIDSVFTCCDCGKPVVLYELPYLENREDHNDIQLWQDNYAAMDMLWLNCLCDRYTGNQRVKLDSALNKQGIEIAEYMSKQLGYPVYYHLECDYGKSIKAKNEDYNCNGRSCHYKSRCKTECIGDYLTRNGYADYVRSTYPNPITIKDKGYSKKDGKSYAQAICEDATLRHRAYVNAAWSRSLNNGVFYDCNPYSDVDRLIMRLLNDEKDIHWIKTNEEFKLGVNKFTIKQKNGILYISHQGAENCVINDGQIYWCDDHFYDFQSSAISGVNISFTVDNNKDKQLVLSDSYTILCIKNGNQEFYFDNSTT